MLRSFRAMGLFLILASLILSACGLLGGTQSPTTDPQAVYTSAAQTVGAELTRSGALTPSTTPTSTVTATETIVAATASPTATTPAATLTISATPTSSTLPDKAQWVSQSIADGTQFNPGQPIIMSWILKNVGTTTWTTAYSAKFYAGDLMGALTSVALTNTVKPGDQIEIKVDFVAPDTLGKKNSIWVLQNANGVNFYPFNLNIEVVAAAPTNTLPPATQTSTPQPTFTITPTITTTQTP